MMPRKFSPGRCSDIVQEARPLRAAWQKTRLQEFPPHDGARPRRSSSGDPRQKHETDGEQFEPALARTASSLELEQNLQLAKITAIQNMTSSCPFMPWEGNLDNPPIYLPSEKDGVREVMSECSTTPDKGNEAESRICTPISELSSDEMEEGEQEDTTLKRGVRHVARRDNVSHLSIAKKKASPTILKRPGKRGSAYDADFPAPSVSSRDRSRSPVHDDRRCRELLYKKARLVLRQMCYMRSREELLFRAAVRFQHKRLDLQEQHSMLVQKARSVGRKKPDDMLDYMSSMSSVSILREITNGPLWRRHRHRHDHRHHYDSSRDSDTRTVHDDVTSGTVRVGLAESQSVHDSTANDDEPSTSKGIRKRPNNHWHHNRTGNLDGDSDSFASRSQSSVSSPTGKKRRKKDGNAMKDDDDEDDDEDSRSSSFEDDDGDDDDDADDETKKSSTKVDDDAKSESSDDDSDSPRNAGFYRKP
nr:hypothetical protein BaRGS_016389 [Batillaria attramentaria]